jgi:Flp pilus assembly protein TadD
MALAQSPAPARRAEVLNERGNSKLDKGDFDGAIVDYSKAVELKADFASAYSNRGIAKADKGDFDGAIADYAKAIELRPDFADAYNNRGIAKQSKGDFDGAIADYSKAIQFGPADADAYNNRGIAKADKGDFDGAIADSTRAIQLNLDSARDSNNRKAIESRPEFVRWFDNRNATAYFSRGNAKANKGDFDGAIADYTKAIELNPSFAGAFNNRNNARKAKTVRAICATIIGTAIICITLFLVFRRRVVKRRAELSPKNVEPAQPPASAAGPRGPIDDSRDAKLEKNRGEAGPTSRKPFRGLSLTIGIGTCVVICLAGAALLRRPGKLLGLFVTLLPEGDPYGGMVSALHRGMSSKDVVTALGAPYLGLRDSLGSIESLQYRKDGTNTLLNIEFVGGGAITEWDILVPQNHRDGATAVIHKSGPDSYEVTEQHLMR